MAGSEPRADAVLSAQGRDTYRHAATLRVCGVPLEPGERVLCVVGRSRDVGIRAMLFALGLATLVVGVGIALIVTALVYSRYSPRAHIITDRRLIVVDPRGVPASVPLDQITAVYPGAGLDTRRRRAVETHVAPGWRDAIELLVSRGPELDEHHWLGADFVRVLLRDGREVALRTAAPEVIGPTLRACLHSAAVRATLPALSSEV